MARGKKTDNETIYKIMISMFTTNNIEETAKQLNMPPTTVKDIYKRNENKPEFVELRSKKTDKFIEKANEIIDKAMERLLEELQDRENRIPVNNLSTVIGTLVDKRNLAEGKATTSTDINIKMDKKVEELSQ